MTDGADNADPGAQIDPRYYADGLKWEDDVIRRLRRSRAFAWIAALLGWVAALVALLCLALLIPLKQFEPYVIAVDKTTGYLEIARALRPGTLDQEEAVTVANIVRFVRARETYDPHLIRENFDIAALLSADTARADLLSLYAAANANRPDRLYGRDVTVGVDVKSVSLLNSRTATVRLTTTERSQQASVVRNWVSIIRFRYTSEPMRNEWRFDNPLGFQVVSYRRDQESLPPAQGSGQ